MGLARAFLTVGGLTMLSRVLGFVRDVMIAALLGAGPVAEAFFVAFRFPNLFRRLFAEGAFNSAFVPLFAKKLEGEGAGRARIFAEDALAGLGSVLIVFTLVLQLAMPWAIYLLASGFADDPEKRDLAVIFSRICFPYLLFMAVTALFSGVLNSLGRFAAAAAAPVLLNLILIAAMVWAQIGGRGAAADVGYALSWGVFAAGIAQALLVWRAAWAAGMPLVPAFPRWTPDLRRLVALGIPGIIAGGAMQINLVIGTLIASFFDGAVAWLSFADRIYQLPLGLIGVAVGVVLLPSLARHVRADETEQANGAMNRAAEFALFLTLPAAAALAVIPEVIVIGLFQRGAFTAEDARMTAEAVRIFALGLPAFVLLKVVAPAWYAREDTRTPMRFALIAMAANTVISLALAPFMGFVAVAIGTSIAAWLNLLLLLVRLPAAGAYDLDPRLKRRLPRMVIATAVMALALLGLVGSGAELWTPWPLLSLLMITALGGAAYFAAAAAAGAFEPGDLAAVRRR